MDPRAWFGRSEQLLLSLIPSRPVTSSCYRRAGLCPGNLLQRQIQSSPRTSRGVTLSSQPGTSSAFESGSSASRQTEPLRSPETAASVLRGLPLSQILRTYLITSFSSSPALLNASSTLLRRILDSTSPLLDPERNHLLRSLLWESFYKQFCAGETAAQVAKSCSDLRSQGYAGVILEYALEVLKDAKGNEIEDVAIWRKGMLDSVDYAAEGDFVGLKWSGMGSAALRRLKARQDPSKSMSEAMNAVCKAAAAKNISLLPAAEETWTLDGINAWSLDLQRTYNRKGSNVVLNTYQAYLRQTPGILSRHLATAKAEGFALGVKLVRGAYMSTEDRRLILPSAEATHTAYDSLASALILRKYNDTLTPCLSTSSDEMPPVNVVLATHNAESVRKARELRQEQTKIGHALTPLAFAQLQGMADEVSCSLIAASSATNNADSAGSERVFKCTTWGSVTQCLNYLLRRAAENKDAAGRTRDTRIAMQAELWRRARSMVGTA